VSKPNLRPVDFLRALKTNGLTPFSTFFQELIEAGPPEVEICVGYLPHPWDHTIHAVDYYNDRHTSDRFGIFAP